MADLPHTICFRASTRMKDWLQQLAKANRRKLGDVVRLLLEKIYEENESRNG